jgi:hypothetical protein
MTRRFKLSPSSSSGLRFSIVWLTSCAALETSEFC